MKHCLGWISVIYNIFFLYNRRKQKTNRKRKWLGTGDARGLITSDVNALDDTYHNIYDVLQANYEGNRNSHPDVDFEETKL